MTCFKELVEERYEVLLSRHLAEHFDALLGVERVRREVLLDMAVMDRFVRHEMERLWRQLRFEFHQDEQRQMYAYFLECIHDPFWRTDLVARLTNFDCWDDFANGFLVMMDRLELILERAEVDRALKGLFQCYARVFEHIRRRLLKRLGDD